MPLFNLQVNKAVLLVHAGDDPGIIINRDLVNQVALGNNPAFPGIFASIIDPLTFIQYSGDVDIWASALVAPCTVDVQPNNENWAPGPVQAAQSLVASGLMLDTTGQGIFGQVTGVAKDASLTPLAKDATITGVAKDVTVTGLNTGIPNNMATTGVPLLSWANVVLNISNQTLTASSQTTLISNAPVIQTGYEIMINADIAGGATKPYLGVHIRWTDAGSGQIVGVDFYDIAINTTGQGCTTVGVGPVKSNQMTMIVFNRDPAVSINLIKMVLVQTSRVPANDKWYSNPLTSTPSPAFPGLQTAWGTVQGRQLMQLTRTVSNGITTNPYLLPVWFGMSKITFGGAGSTGWFVSASTVEDGTVLWQSTPNVSRVNEDFVLPREPVTITFTNNNSTVQQMNVQVIGLDV
jgi:hypothetical protein